MEIDLVMGSDHRGYKLKQLIEKYLIPIDKDIKRDISLYMDCGCHDEKSVDYPDVVKDMAEEMVGTFNFGILICGSGFGVCMAANRFPHMRAITARTPKEAEMSRKHNDANVLCLGADFTSERKARDIVNAFLTTEFEGGRHQRRVNKLLNLYS
tara:strand:- start:861 stop:1322 length:462 start_codon:yes stop_codon:yes gene_type:complete